MGAFEESRQERMPRFRPALEGCVAKDVRLSRMVGAVWGEAFTVCSRTLEGALFLLPTDRAAGEALYRDAQDCMEELRILGELTVVLGGSVSPCLRRGGWRRDGDRLLEEALRLRRRRIEALESLMGKTGDRVVRSVIAGAISACRRSASRLDSARRASLDTVGK